MDDLLKSYCIILRKKLWCHGGTVLSLHSAVGYQWIHSFKWIQWLDAIMILYHRYTVAEPIKEKTYIIVIFKSFVSGVESINEQW